MRLHLHEEARREFLEASDYYSEKSVHAANRFIDEVETALSDLTLSPLRWKVYRRHYRVRVLRRFPYSIFYRIRDDELFVLAIYHEARKPGRWMKRDR